MATVTEKKLAYLQGTKDALKAALVEKGQTVSDTDTFRSYADKVKAIQTGIDITLLENIPFALDFSDGNQFVDAGEGYAVKSAIIMKPDTLIPENIKAGVRIAGIEGTHEGGGGSSADVRYVTFTNASTGETFVKPVAVGDDCVDVVAKGLLATPTQESTAQYDYTFSGSWSATPNGEADPNILKNITEDNTVYAVFTAIVRTYTITYLDSDGVTVLNTETKNYGDMPSYTPTKDGYKFEGWTPALSSVTGNATYTAAWKEVTGGSCGTNATWLLEDGVLTISGTGTITGRAATSYPWYPNINIIKEVIIEDGITNVPTEAFYDYTKLEKVTIGDSVTVINTGAFQSCDILSDVTLGSGLTQMNQRVFNGCSELTTITIPASVTLMDTKVFSSTLKSAIFENPNGWWWAYNTSNTSGTAISASDLSNPSTAATLLGSTHQSRVWRRS